MIWLARICRALAVAIAIAAAVDPILPLVRSDRRTVAIVNTGDAADAERISRALSREFDVHAGPIAGAAATIVAGDAVPASPIATSGALFAVLPAAATPRIEIEKATAPSIAPSGSKIAIAARMRFVGMRGRTVIVDLFAGALAVDSAKRVVSNDDERMEITLTLAPSAAGLLTARLLARDEANRSLAADRHLAVDVRDQRWRVLVADARPSWASTFIRRALEADRRFDIASRVGMSKTIEASAGAAPLLTDAAALAQFDAIVIGAPDELAAAEARALERYARERGGSVILLLDRLDLGSSATLAGMSALGDVHGNERVKITSAAGDLVATELALPRGDALISPLARAPVGGKETPVIWQTALGAGRVIVNGALDAWRYRTREGGGFTRFWTDAIGAAAGASPRPLVVTTDSLLVEPGAAFEIRAIVRDAQLSDPGRPAPAVELSGPVQFWPAAERGVFAAPVTASDKPGNYELEVQGSSVQGARGAERLRYVVSETARRSEPALLSAWTTSRGGTVLADGDDALVSRVRAAISAQRERVETHPMRSLWWLPVFVILLGGEWWVRRRRGER